MNAFLLAASDGVVNWGNVVLIGILCGLFVALIAIVGVILSYHRKNRSPIYPLDQFTNLNLTEKEDRYLYTRTTTRTINRDRK